MNKKYLLAAAIAALTVACEPKVAAKEEQPRKSEEKPKGGCCGAENTAPAQSTPAPAQAAPADQAASTVVEVKVESVEAVK